MTSLKLTPAAALMLLSRSMPHDWAATRRAPPIGTLNMVRGAANGRVSCCSTSAARASDHVEGANAAIDPTVSRNVCNRDLTTELLAFLRRGSDQIGRNSGSSGSVDSARCISLRADTPSINEWWNLL